MIKNTTILNTLFLKLTLLICFQLFSFWGFSQKVHIKQLKIGKSINNVFASDYYNDQIYFCSDKKIKSKKSAVNEHNLNFLDLYSVTYDISNKQIGIETNLGDNINTPLNEGPIDFNNQNGKGYFSSNIEDTTTEELYLGLFETQSINNTFAKRNPLFDQTYNYNIAHPTISEDGNILVFSSDNESSLGQTDLYISFLENNKWSEPKQIANINTAAIETFPHFNDNTLYFSSDREGSIGGLDIWKSQLKDGTFTKPERLKQPFNSEFDDFLFISINETNGLISSNRNNNTDKIFAFNIDLPQPNEFIEVKDNFCFQLEDQGKIDTTRFKHTWHLGNGESLNGTSITYCYTDTGSYNVSCDLLDKQTSKTDIGFIDAIIEIDIETPTIEYENKGGFIQLIVDHKYSKTNYDSYYWVINGTIYMEEKPEFDLNTNELEVKLILWNDEKTIGIRKKLTLNK